MSDAKSLYSGGRIFRAIKPLEQAIASSSITFPGRKNQTEEVRNFYTREYDRVLKRLAEPDILTLDQAAARMSVTSVEYLEKVKKGEALLIEIEGQQAAPAWLFKADGQIDGLKLDIAREFSMEGRSFFKFMDYLTFMTGKEADIPSSIPQDKLAALFNQSGLAAGYEGLNVNIAVSVSATMNQLADSRAKRPEFLQTLTQHLDADITHGGWDCQSGGLSRPFRDKYGIPGITFDEEMEQRLEYTRNHGKQPEPPVG